MSSSAEEDITQKSSQPGGTNPSPSRGSLPPPRKEATDSNKCWETISNCLVMNRCWLCDRVFQRGRVRKVFTVADMLRYLHERYVSEKLREGNFTPGHVFSAINTSSTSKEDGIDGNSTADSTSLNTQGNDKESNDATSTQTPSLPQNNDDAYTCILQSQNLSACYRRYYECEGNSVLIEQELKEVDMAVWMSGLVCYTTEECAKEFDLMIPNAESNRGPLPSMKKFAPDEKCPPGCGCDNPWPFLSS